MFNLGRYLYGLCGRVATAVRDLLVIPSEAECATSIPPNSSSMTPEQRQHEEQRQLANADRFYSNGHLVETVPVEGSSSLVEEEEEEDIEAQTATANKKPHAIDNPYQDRNRMTTVMEPVIEMEGVKTVTVGPP